MDKKAFLAGYMEKKAETGSNFVYPLSPYLGAALALSPQLLGAGIGSMMAKPGKGWQGAGYGLLQSLGIPLGASAGGTFGGVAGGLALGLPAAGMGGLIGAAQESGGSPGENAITGLLAGGVPGALAGGGYGAYKGGKYAHDLIRQMVGEKWISDVFGT